MHHSIRARSRPFSTTLHATKFFGAALLCAQLFTGSLHAAPSQWVYYGADGKLAYQTWGSGNTIMDFSSAGYMGGGVTLPTVATVTTLSPSGGDDTAAIQNAINATPSGAIVLGAGTFNLSSTLTINKSNVVLRGSGSGAGGTVLLMGSAMTEAISVAGTGSPTTSTTANLSASYVPAGAMTIDVDNASGFAVGDTILITKTVTDAWRTYMGMASLSWLATGTKITTDRTITAISGNTLTLDAPITDSFDATYLGSPVGTVAKYTWTGRIANVGIEHLKIQAPAGTTIYKAVQMDNTLDSWLEDLVGQETQNAWAVTKNCRRITLDQVRNSISTVQTAGARSADFSVEGTQVLLNKCQANATGTFAFVTGAVGTGPIVLLNFTSTDDSGISPHQRWTTGILSDNCSLPNAPSNTQGISYRNRGSMGSGQGWTTGWSVAWNVTTPYVLVSAAPGTENWCIGCVATKTSTTDPDGIYESLGAPVDLGDSNSLYLEQLRERLGSGALSNIGYPQPSKISIPASSVTASGYASTYVPANTVDGNLSTRWAASGDGVWICYDLGSTRPVSYARLAFYRGDTRTYKFDVQISTDGTSWTTVIAGQQSMATTALTTYNFADTTARYVRVVGHLSSVDSYTNITEAEIWGL